jgi:hypothetical protein
MSELSNDRAGQTPRWVIPAILIGVLSLVGFGVLGVALVMLAGKDGPPGGKAPPAAADKGQGGKRAAVQDGKAGQREDGKTGEVVDGALRVDVKEMMRAYTINQPAADDKYTGKLIEADISLVSPVRKHSDGTYSVGYGVAVFVFPASEKDKLAGLYDFAMKPPPRREGGRFGDNMPGLRIRGRCQGMKGGLVVNDCRLIARLRWQDEPPKGDDAGTGRWVIAK